MQQTTSAYNIFWMHFFHSRQRVNTGRAGKNVLAATNIENIDYHHWTQPVPHSVKSTSKCLPPPCPHRVGGNRKCYQQSTNADRKSIETVFLIAICRQWETNGNQKHFFYWFLSTFLDSIGVFDCRLPDVLSTWHSKHLAHHHGYLETVVMVMTAKRQDKVLVRFKWHLFQRYWYLRNWTCMTLTFNSAKVSRISSNSDLQRMTLVAFVTFSAVMMVIRFIAGLMITGWAWQL